jgi:hypothetical protein
VLCAGLQYYSNANQDLKLGLACFVASSFHVLVCVDHLNSFLAYFKQICCINVWNGVMISCQHQT